MKKLRVYRDTSVFGGCFDEEFAAESRALFEEIKQGKFTLVVSEPAICAERLECLPVRRTQTGGDLSPLSSHCYLFEPRDVLVNLGLKLADFVQGAFGEQGKVTRVLGEYRRAGCPAPDKGAQFAQWLVAVALRSGS